MLQRLETLLDRFSDVMGWIAGVLNLAMLLNVFYDAIMRYFFSSGSIALQEMEWHLFSMVFLFGIAYGLKEDGHVRVDIVYRRLSARGQSLVYLLGTLLLASLSTEALMAYYEAHKVGYTAPEQRRVRHILVTVEGDDDEAFETLASRILDDWPDYLPVLVARLEREYSDLDEVWKAEKAAMQGATAIKEELDRARIELDTAHRAQDLQRMSELQYGRIPELERQLESAAEAEQQEATLVRNKVTEEEIADLFSQFGAVERVKLITDRETGRSVFLDSEGSMDLP